MVTRLTFSDFSGHEHLWAGTQWPSRAHLCLLQVCHHLSCRTLTVVCTLYMILWRLVFPIGRGRLLTGGSNAPEVGSELVAELNWNSSLEFWAHSLGRGSVVVLPACMMSSPGAWTRRQRIQAVVSALATQDSFVGFYSQDLQRLARGWAPVTSCVARAAGRWLRALLSPLEPSMPTGWK